MKYKTIIFDLYHTLVNIHTEEHKDLTWSSFATYLEDYQVSYEFTKLRDKFFEYDAKLRAQPSDFIYPEIDILNVFDQLCQDKGKKLSRDQLTQIGYTFRCYSRELIEVYDGVTDLLSTLRSQGCKVILLSNAQHCFTMPEIQLMKLDSYFNAIYISSDYGCMKPDPNFFELVFQNHKCKASECIMIGDSLNSDIAGADTIGIDSLLLDNRGDQEIPSGSRCIGILRSKRRDGILDFLC